MIGTMDASSLEAVAEAVPGASQHGWSFSSAGKKPRGQQDCLVFFGGEDGPYRKDGVPMRRESL